MKKILIITTPYYPNEDAVSICTHKIAKCLVESGVEVHILCEHYTKKPMEYDYERVNVHALINFKIALRIVSHTKNSDKIINKILYQVARLISITMFLFSLPFTGLCNSAVQRHIIYGNIVRLHKKYHFDMVVVSAPPYEALYSARQFKKKNDRTLFLAYMIDGLSNIGAHHHLSAKTMAKIGLKMENTLYPFCDSILEMVCNEEHYKQAPYNSFLNKMVFVDMPLITHNKTDNNNDVAFKGTIANNNENVKVVYTGFLYNTRSSLIGSYQVFDILSRTSFPNLYYCIYGYGEGEVLAREYEKKTNGHIVYCGRIPHKDALLRQKEADILINIGNYSSKMISAKIFEYMSTGNKIVHFQNNEHDVVVPYLLKYPNALIINLKDEISVNIKKVEEFILTKKAGIGIDYLIETFPKNTPQFTADIVISCLNKTVR